LRTPRSMRFRLRFTRGPANEFKVTNGRLQLNSDTRLSRLAAVAIAAGDTSVDLGPMATADNNWASGTVAQIRAWYGGSRRTFLPGVELREWVAIASWLELPAEGNLESISYDDDSQDDGFAREVRVRSYLKSKSDVVLSVAHVKRMMRAHVARNPITFGLLRTTDDATYVNRSLSRPLLVFGVGGSDAARYGSPDDAYDWAEDGDLREDCKRRVEHWGMEVAWTHTRLELSGARGLEPPPSGLTPVYGHRWVLEVMVPPSDHPVKRQRFSAVHAVARPRRGAPPAAPPPAVGPPTAGGSSSVDA